MHIIHKLNYFNAFQQNQPLSIRETNDTCCVLRIKTKNMNEKKEHRELFDFFRSHNAMEGIQNNET